MKLFTLLLLFLFSISSYHVSAEWEVVNTPLSNNVTIYEVYFVNQNTGFFTTDNNLSGQIYKTTNAGNSWYLVYSGDLLVQKMEFAGQHGYSACYNLLNQKGDILKTSDFGESWTPANIVSIEGCTDIYVNESQVHVSAFLGDMFHSSNNGNAWTYDSTLSLYVLNSIGNFNNTLHITSAYMMYKQVNQETWQYVSHHGIYSFGGFTIHNNNMYIGGDNLSATHPAITYTSNYGESWVVQELPQAGAVRTIEFVGDDGYAVGDIGSDYYRGNYINNTQTFSFSENTLNGCIWRKRKTDTTWVVDYILPMTNWFGFLKICKAGPDLWVAGGDGIILKNRGIISGISSSANQTTDYSLSQNYPNPFNPTTTISFSIPTTAKITLSIFDVNGRKLETLINEQKSPGNYEVEFDGSNFSSGTYFYKITVGEFTETKRMVLIK